MEGRNAFLSQRLFEYLLENLEKDIPDLQERAAGIFGLGSIRYWLDKEQNSFGVEFFRKGKQIRVQKSCGWDYEGLEIWVNGGAPARNTSEFWMSAITATLFDPRLVILFLQNRQERPGDDSFVITGIISTAFYMRQFSNIPKEETTAILGNVPDAAEGSTFLVSIEGVPDFSQVTICLHTYKTLAKDEPFFQFSTSCSDE